MINSLNCRKEHGFTLIEIIIALAIVAIAVLAIANGMNQHTRISSELEKRVLASWVAANMVAELRFDAKTENIRTGSSSDLVEMGGHRWRASAHITETDFEQIYLLRVEVKDEGARNDADYATLITAISGT